MPWGKTDPTGHKPGISMSHGYIPNTALEQHNIQLFSHYTMLIKFDCSKLYFELSRGQKRHFEGYLSSFASFLVLWKGYSLLTTFETSEKSQYWFVCYGTTLHGQQNDEAPLVTSMKCVNKLTFFKYSDSFSHFYDFRQV